jgi:hypothetical protein
VQVPDRVEQVTARCSQSRVTFLPRCALDARTASGKDEIVALSCQLIKNQLGEHDIPRALQDRVPAAAPAPVRACAHRYNGHMTQDVTCTLTELQCFFQRIAMSDGLPFCIERL